MILQLCANTESRKRRSLILQKLNIKHFKEYDNQSSNYNIIQNIFDFKLYLTYRIGQFKKEEINFRAVTDIPTELTQIFA